MSAEPSNAFIESSNPAQQSYIIQCKLQKTISTELLIWCLSQACVWCRETLGSLEAHKYRRKLKVYVAGVSRLWFFPMLSLSPSVWRWSDLKESLHKRWKEIETHCGISQSDLFSTMFWSLRRWLLFLGLFFPFFFFDESIHLASVFVLSLCSEQPVNKEFSAVGSLEATAAVDITCHCDLFPAQEWTNPNTWAREGRNAL